MYYCSKKAYQKRFVNLVLKYHKKLWYYTYELISKFGKFKRHPSGIRLETLRSQPRQTQRCNPMTLGLRSHLVVIVEAWTFYLFSAFIRAY